MGFTATPHLNTFLLVPQHHGGHVTPVSPTPYTDPRDVKVLESLQQMPQHGQLILNLDAADSPEQVPLPLAPGAPYVQPDVHHVVVAGHVRSPVDLEPIGDSFAAWAAVHLDQHWESRVSQLLSPRRRQ